jgi:hypothetical protein
MRSLRKSVAFGSAGLAVLSLATWLVSAGRQSPGDQNGGGDVIVCVGTDAVLRDAGSGDCPAGSARLALSGPDRKARDVDGDEGDPLGTNEATTNQKPGSDHLADLARRLDRLNKSSLFTVVNKQGNPIFTVTPQGAAVFNSDKRAVASMGAREGEEGGYFVAQSADGRLRTSLGADGLWGGVRVREGNVTRLEMGRRAGGNYSLTFPSLKASGDPVAAVGESRAGTGALVVGDAAGRIKASMTAADDRGRFSVFNDGGNALLSLTETATGGGLFSLGDKNSETMVKMGVKDDRYGVVLAGPRAGFPLVLKSGLPGSYFMGCAGGPACQP